MRRFACCVGNRLSFLVAVIVQVCFLHQHNYYGVQAHEHHHDEHGGHCGTPMPSLSEELISKLRLDGLREVADGSFSDRRRLQHASCHELCDQCIEVEVYLHLVGTNLGFGPVIPHPQSAYDKAKKNVTSVTVKDFLTKENVMDIFDKNMDVVNRAFTGTPFRFKFVQNETTLSINPFWSSAAMNYREEISKAVGVPDLRRLNVYVAKGLRPTRGLQMGEILGTATLPGSQEVGKGDGVYVRYDVLTGGGREDNDLGYTLVHEVGHWLGLLHTFQTFVSRTPCDKLEDGLGDFVDDTPMQNGPSSLMIQDCKQYLGNARPLPDTCPNLPGRDAFFNYLNYLGNEECLAEEGSFTCGQKERMHRLWLLFRDQVVTCEDPNDMEIEVIFALDHNYQRENTFTLVNENGNVLFDSLQDHWVAYLVSQQESLYVDICVPRNMNYELHVKDEGRNGFFDGRIVVYADRNLVDRVRGNFGATAVVSIPSQPLPTTAPSLSLSPSESNRPSLAPSISSEPSVTFAPSSMHNVFRHTSTPTAAPSIRPTSSPSNWPSISPSNWPSNEPSFLPSSQPSAIPTTIPTSIPSEVPSTLPSAVPSHAPSYTPSNTPSHSPSTSPSQAPSSEPTRAPSEGPSMAPSLLPSDAPSGSPLVTSAIQERAASSSYSRHPKGITFTLLLLLFFAFR